MSSKKVSIKKTVLASMFLALALVLPFATGQIPVVGKALCPMHFPVILCGYFCGPWYALAIGIISPLLRFVLFGMPVIFPTGAVMCLELATYGFVAGLLYKLFPKKLPFIYVSLIAAMLAGRVVWGAASAALNGFGLKEFGWEAFAMGGFVNALPGIVAQIVIIPVIVTLLKKQTNID